MSALATLYSSGDGLGLLSWLVILAIVVAAAVAAWRGVWIVAGALVVVALVAAAVL